MFEVLSAFEHISILTEQIVLVRKIIYTLALLTSLTATAQQEGLFTQYMYNPASLNTAYTGSREEQTLYFQYRSQWNKLEGSPERLYLNYQKPGDNKLSYGISLSQEETGPMSQTTFGVDLAYMLQLNETSFLSLGIKPMVDLLDVRFDQLNIYNPQDPWFSVNIDQRASPNVGLGLFYYDQGGYIGLSTTGIFATKYFDQASPSSFLAADRAHYYLMAGSVIPLGDEVLFKPSFLIRHVKGVDLQMDISANFRIQEAVEAGLSYRLSGAVSTLAAFRVQRNLLLGYSYDKETGRFGTFSGSTNEIFIRYEFLPKTIKTIVKPRFF